MSGTAAGVPAAQWLTAGHRRAKTATNCVSNRWADGPVERTEYRIWRPGAQLNCQTRRARLSRICAAWFAGTMTECEWLAIAGSR